MQKELLTERQRREIAAYLKEVPNLMPPYVRGLRKEMQAIDFDQMKRDITMMQSLVAMQIPIGRKKTNWRTLPAYLNVRQQAAVGLPAHLQTGRRKES